MTSNTAARGRRLLFDLRLIQLEPCTAVTSGFCFIVRSQPRSDCDYGIKSIDAKFYFKFKEYIWTNSATYPIVESELKLLG